MRPYRAIPIGGKDFVYGWYVENWNHGVFSKATGSYIIDKFGTWHIVIPETVGQYTGLKDKKRTEEYPEGQEIYEGDIVRGVWLTDHNTVFTGTVKYWEKYGLYGLDEKASLVSVVWDGCEIIGDIHTTPKLLEKQ